jgi:hypothetical protein
VGVTLPNFKNCTARSVKKQFQSALATAYAGFGYAMIVVQNRPTALMVRLKPSGISIAKQSVQIVPLKPPARGPKHARRKFTGGIMPKHLGQNQLSKCWGIGF